MTVEQLSELLAKFGVPRTVYSLSGGLPDESCCLERTATGWQTYYSERGERTSLKTFSTEANACAYFIVFLQEDSHLRKIIQEGLARMGI